MIDLSPVSTEETLQERKHDVARCVCVHACVCVGECIHVFMCVCAHACVHTVRVCVCTTLLHTKPNDWWSEAHTHHQWGICEVCESGAVIPLSLLQQTPLWLIYSKSLKSAYYCSSSSPTPSLSPHNQPLPQICHCREKERVREREVEREERET